MESKELVIQLIKWAEKYQVEDILRILKNKSFPDSIEALKNIRSLDLSYKGLDSLPSYLFDLSSLEILNLSHNQLIKLPREITKLNNLQFLDISWNHIMHDTDFVSLNIKIKKAWNRQ